MVPLAAQFAVEAAVLIDETARDRSEIVVAADRTGQVGGRCHVELGWLGVSQHAGGPATDMSP